MTENLIWLISAHAIGDMGLQHIGISKLKLFFPMVMLAHSIIEAGCICVALKYMKRYSNIKFLFLVEMHFLTDYLSILFSWYFEYNRMWVNLADQMLHLAQILFVYFI